MYLDIYQVLGDIGYKYSKSRHTKDCGQEPAKMMKFNINPENNAIFKNAVYDFILQENNKLSAEYEAHENIDYDIDKDDIYEIDNISLD